MFLIVARTQPNVAAIFRIVEYSTVQILHEGRTGPARHLVFPEPARETWCGWFSHKIASNGWEPYDQPHPCAYLPFAYHDGAMHTLAGGGCLLRMKQWNKSPRRFGIPSGPGSMVFHEASRAAITERLRRTLAELGIQDTPVRVNFLALSGEPGD